MYRVNGTATLIIDPQASSSVTVYIRFPPFDQWLAPQPLKMEELKPLWYLPQFSWNKTPMPDKGRYAKGKKTPTTTIHRNRSSDRRVRAGGHITK